jgi:hypothetical protein
MFYIKDFPGMKRNILGYIWVFLAEEFNNFA